MNLRDDRVLKFLDSCQGAGIRNPETLIAAKMTQIYDWLKGAFPRGILPTDIDGEVELNAYFLRFEFKAEDRLRNGEIPRGQDIAFRTITDVAPFTVFVIGNDINGEPTCMQTYYAGKLGPLQEITKEGIRERVIAWVAFVQSKPRPPKFPNQPPQP